MAVPARPGKVMMAVAVPLLAERILSAEAEAGRPVLELRQLNVLPAAGALELPHQLTGRPLLMPVAVAAVRVAVILLVAGVLAAEEVAVRKPTELPEQTV